MSLAQFRKTKAEARAAILMAAQAILTVAHTEKRDLTAEQKQEWDKRHSEGDELRKDIERIDKQLEAERSLGELAPDSRGAGKEDRGGDDDKLSEATEKSKLKVRNHAIRSYLAGGMTNLSPDLQQEMRGMYAKLSPEEQRAVTTTNANGGYTIAPDTSFYGKVVEGMKQFALDENLFDVITTKTGATMPIPTLDDTANTDASKAETVAAGAATDFTFGQVSLGAYVRSTGILKVSMELLQDTDADIEGLIGKKLGERAGRSKAALLTTGTGAGQPQGIVVGSTLGKTAAGAAAITYNELLDLQHSVDPAYRPNARYMLNDTTLLALKKLVDSQGRPLYLPGLADREPDRINGYQYVINQNMASLATGNKTVLFGDFKNYMVRNVKGFMLLRLAERYAEEGVVGFIGFSRYDAKVVNAGTNPIKHLIQA